MSPRALSLALVLALPLAALARVGGGQSYSGSSSSRSSSSSSSRSSSSSSSWSGSSSRSSSGFSASSGGTVSTGGACDVLQVFVLVTIIIIVVSVAKRKRGAVYAPTGEGVAPPPHRTVSIAERMRALDPSFSEPVFLEWATLLFIRAQKARGGDLAGLEPWFTKPTEQLGPRLGDFTLSQVRGVVVGSQKLTELQPQGDAVTLAVLFQACLTADVGGRAQSLYLHERWVFRRKQGVVSRTPDTVERAGCPSCGAPFERTSAGRCTSCGASLAPGASDWGVFAIRLQRLETRAPLLEGTVEEIGTDLSTIVDPGLAAGLDGLRQAGFDEKKFLERARVIFFALQQGWTHQAWDTLRPYETESVFQSHRFWMEEYRKQGLRNVLGAIRLQRVELVKVTTDAAYEAITCRLHAAMRDSTVRVKDGSVVGGNPRADRVFTEYWTFLRRPGAASVQPDDRCPNCGAPLKVTQAGICEYCQASITRGQFDWVLSRIEQDEDYSG